MPQDTGGSNEAEHPVQLRRDADGEVELYSWRSPDRWLGFTAGEFAAFLRQVKAGDYDEFLTDG
ncbi:hypothetical protein [Actinomadura yumaensis]|uniref:DUF397 domain-containing protein n=1 Tax=Actinomadura yumaensis TaxID=111807 RepID=A0ABW2CS46_9ACTN